MEILCHFDRSENDGVHVYRLKEAQWDDFINKLTDEFRQSYIDDDELEEIAELNEIRQSEYLERYILPDKGNIKSGDFGEMLSFYAAIENFRNKGVSLIGPYKWMWKDRNKAAQYSDAVLFSRNTGGRDVLIAIESKMKATHSNNHRLQDAVKGAEDDKLTRLTKTLTWLEEKYARLGDVQNRQMVERFSNPSEHGEFDKFFKAIAIVDRAFENFELENELTKKEDEVVVLLFSIDDLQNAYEQTRLNIINSVD